MQVENEYVRIYSEDGIVIGEIKQNAYIDLAGAKKIVEERKKFTNYSNSLILLDATEVKGISKEARDFFGTNEGTELVIASAIYTNSKLSNFLANFLMKVNLINTYVPVRLFTNKDEAIRWLKKYK